MYVVRALRLAPTREGKASSAYRSASSDARLLSALLSRRRAARTLEAMPAFVTYEDVGGQAFTIDERYTNLRTIGQGAYGVVARATDTRTGRSVAIKKVKTVFRDLVDAKRILREMKLLRHCSHENIVRLYDIMVPPLGESGFEDLYMVTSLMETDLHRIIGSRQRLSDQHVQYFLYQLLCGLNYIHSAGILHRDLKPSNILVNSNCDLRICDFGLSRSVDGSKADALTEYVTTRWYRAPELLFELQNYDDRVDMWSVGCIFGEMLRRRALFRGRSPPHQLEVIIDRLGISRDQDLDFLPPSRASARDQVLRYAEQSGCPRIPFERIFPENTSPIAIQLLLRTLEWHPRRRFSAADCLAHSYLENFHSASSTDKVAASTAVQTGAFDFEHEGFGPDHELPKDRLQSLMYQEMMSFRGGVEMRGTGAGHLDHYQRADGAGEGVAADFSK